MMRHQARGNDRSGHDLIGRDGRLQAMRVVDPVIDLGAEKAFLALLEIRIERVRESCRSCPVLDARTDDGRKLVEPCGRAAVACRQYPSALRAVVDEEEVRRPRVICGAGAPACWSCARHARRLVSEGVFRRVFDPRRANHGGAKITRQRRAEP